MKKKIKWVIGSIITTIFFNNIAFGATTNQKIILKKSNDINSETLMIIEKGQTIELLNYVDDFSLIKYNNKLGFVETELLNINIGSPNTSEIKVDIVPYDMKDIVYKELYDSVKNSVAVKGIEFTNPEQTDLKERASKVVFPTWEEAKSIVTIGKDIEVYDILTGKIYYIRSFSNGSHADVETVTAKDTQIAFETFNKVWDWDVRPVWITINGVSMASSINGMPHGEDTNENNNMTGQICLHFLDSKTHNGNEAYTKLHQDVAKEAYDYSIQYRK